ncbi:hypothetical protein GJ496_008489 [Pomphorhynchus laevis]|nr:hypothetical protein GJ496_008489 [Pomphorhynchus laevis]
MPKKHYGYKDPLIATAVEYCDIQIAYDSEGCDLWTMMIFVKDVSPNTDGRFICGFCSVSKIQALEGICKQLELKNTHSAMCEPFVARNATLASGWSTPLRPASAKLLEMKTTDQ